MFSTTATTRTQTNDDSSTSLLRSWREKATSGSFDSNTSAVNEVNELKKLNKFTVIKNIDESVLSSQAKIQNLENESEDFFEEDEELEFPQTINNNNRFSEGQDTITSLKNPIFMKQISDMKRKSSIKSNRSVNTNNLQVNDGQLINRRSLNSSILNIFKSQESIISKKSNNKNANESNILDLNGSMSMLSKQKFRTNSDNVSLMQPEKIADTVAEIIKNNNDDSELSQKLLNQLKLLIAESKRMEQKRIIRLRRLSKIFICLIVLFTALMAIVVVVCVGAQLQTLQRNFNNDTLNFNETSNTLHNKIGNLYKLINKNNNNSSRFG